ncbi:MAG TPA: DedA family protein [Terriglobia bacterium]|nr:DedA family protein [Terriglobia bacterium]
MTFEYLISHYGYVALVIGTFLEGETILIAAGFAAHVGYLELQWVMLAAFVGSLAGDQFYFFVGRARGRTFLHRRPAWEAKVEKVFKLFDRHRTLVVLGFRFMYGLRTVTPFAFGLSGISTSRFFILNLIGAVVWSVALALVGYLFGAAARAVMVDVRKYEHWVILGMLWTGALVYIIYFLHKREIDRAEGRP